MRRLLLLTIYTFIVLSAVAQSDKPAGYYNLTQLSFIIGEVEYLSPTGANLVPSITTVNGYRFNEHISAGIGVGVAAYSYMVYPVFTDLRWHVFKDGFTPVLAFRGGYSFANSEKEYLTNYDYNATYKNSGGWMCNPEIGFKTTINPNFDFVLTVGYYYQKLESEIKSQSYPRYAINNLSTNVNRLTLSIGFLFK